MRPQESLNERGRSSGNARSRCRSPARRIRPARIASSTANSSSSPTGPIRTRCAQWSRSRSRSRTPIVKYEFIRMPDSTGFGDYTESGQVIPVSFRGEQGRLRPLHVPRRRPADRRRARAVGLSRRSSPRPSLKVEKDTLGRHAAAIGPVRVAIGTMGYKHRAIDNDRSRESVEAPELPAQDHPARRRHAAHLRTGAIPAARTSP